MCLRTIRSSSSGPFIHQGRRTVRTWPSRLYARLVDRCNRPRKCELSHMMALQPLKDVVILDFSTLLPGPLATLILAEAGAEVIKIERPTGDDLREWTPRWGSESVQYAMLNRGKKIVALDLKDPASHDTMHALLERADVLVEQFRPGVMAR